MIKEKYDVLKLCGKMMIGMANTEPLDKESAFVLADKLNLTAQPFRYMVSSEIDFSTWPSHSEWDN